MPYKHYQRKGIKKNSQNDSRMLCLNNLAIMWELLLCRQSFRKRTYEISIKNKIKQVMIVR